MDQRIDDAEFIPFSANLRTDREFGLMGRSSSWRDSGR